MRSFLAADDSVALFHLELRRLHQLLAAHDLGNAQNTLHRRRLRLKAAARLLLELRCPAARARVDVKRSSPLLRRRRLDVRKRRHLLAQLS